MTRPIDTVIREATAEILDLRCQLGVAKAVVDRQSSAIATLQEEARAQRAADRHRIAELEALLAVAVASESTIARAAKLWMVVRIRETEPPEVWRGDEQEMADLFEQVGANWTETFLVRIAVGPGDDGRIDDRKRLRAPLTFDKVAADALADEVAVLVRRKAIDSRSPAADALLSYRDPPTTPRADRMAQLELEILELAGVKRRELGRCPAKGCANTADPRWLVHGINGNPVPACDGHGNPDCPCEPCTCPELEAGPRLR